jgi:IS6 family transposase
MRALRNGQAAAFNRTRDTRGEARIVERAFGLGSPIMAEVIQLVTKQLELNAT